MADAGTDSPEIVPNRIISRWPHGVPRVEFVYVVQSGDEPFVKVGRTANVYMRLNSLRTGNPHPINLLVLLIGGEERERELHMRLRRYHQRNEWFRLEEPVQELIEELKAEDVDHDALALLKRREAVMALCPNSPTA